MLTVDRTSFRFLYRLMLIGSWGINVGNWVFFTRYLKLEGELFCPSKVSSVMAQWTLFPLGVDLLFGLFRFLTDSA